MNLRTFVLTLAALLVALTFSAAQTLVVPPGPGSLAQASHLFQSNDYTVEVKRSGDANYTTCFVYETDNWASNLWGGERRPQIGASFVNFSFDGGPVDVRITTSFTANSVTIRPLAYGVVPTRSGYVITFTLATPRKISVEVNNRLNPLFIFADQPDVVPDPANVTHYFGPGYHDIGLHMQLNSNETVYIAGGAVLEGTFYIPTGTHDVTVRGRGIISGGKLPTAEERTNSIHAIQRYSVFTGRRDNYGTTIHYNMNFEGFTMVNTCGTHFAMVNANHQNHHNTFRNLKAVDWSVNTDFVVDGDDNIVDDCFFFTNDDMTVTRSAFRLRITNCVFWNFIGRLLWTANYGTSSDCLWENIEVIGDDKGPDFTDIYSGNSGMMRNFTFRNINIESRASKFIKIRTGNTKIENWLFENITFPDLKANEGAFVGNGTGTMDITFRNLKMGGSYITSLAQGNMTADQYCDIKFEVQPPDPPPPAGVVRARFTDGNGSGTAQQYPGVAGDGWSSGWVGSAALIPAVVTTAPLKTGSGNYMKVERTGGTNGLEGTYRRFSSATRPYTQFTRQSFDFRLDSPLSVFNASGDSILLGDRSVAAVGVAGDATWYVRATGAAFGRMQAREWCVFNGTPGITDPYSPNTFIPTGLICQPGVVYTITVDVYSAASAGNTGGRIHGTYDVTITDGTNTVKVSGAGFRSDAYALGGNLSFSTQQSSASDDLTFSVDNIEMTSLAPAALPPVAIWRSLHFPSNILADPTLESSRWGNLADYDSDGSANVVEYATCTNPVHGGDAGKPSAALDALGRLTLTFNRIADPALHYKVIASGDFALWPEIWSSTGAQNTAGSVTVTDSAPASSPKRFLQLKVTLP